MRAAAALDWQLRNLSFAGNAQLDGFAARMIRDAPADLITLKVGINLVNADSMRERALNEATAYAIRIDVAEELARLRAHLDEIERLLKAGGEVGKRLDFLIQELQREANTLASKSAALELTNVSVEMKVLVEQMREQVQNIE